MNSSAEISVEELFYSEAENRLRDIRGFLEKYGEDGSKREELAQTLHTLKGSAAMMGQQAVSDLAHKMEDVLASANERTPEQLSALSKLLEEMGQLLFPDSAENDSDDENTGGRKSPQLLRSLHAYKLLTGMSRLRSLFRNQDSSEGFASWRWKSGFERELKLLSRAALDTVFSPVEELFSGLPELCRSLLEAEGKEAKLVTKSRQHFILRDLIPDLRVCLIHLISNSIVHGLEDPKDRQASGKDPIGLLSLKISLRGNNLVITLGDDGRGVDLGKLKDKLAKRHPELDWENLDRSEKLDLLFGSGTTLAEQLTVRAGRGVGLSAVRDAARRLGGTAKFVDTKTLSTAIRLEIPVPIFMEQCLEVNCGPTTLLVTSHSVRSVDAVSNSQLKEFQMLSDFLGLPGPSEKDGGSIALIGKKETGCTVSEVLGISNVLVYPIPTLVSVHQAIVGIAEFDTDTGLAYVVNLSQIDDSRPARTPRAQVADLRTTNSKVLVVDDSATTRSILVEVLRRAGYAVKEATDGREGLKSLSEGQFDLIVSDYEMPNMNGLEFLEALRDDQGVHRDIPFLLFTSRDDDETFEKALLLGADRCLSKAYFDEGQFLKVLERFLS